MQIVEINKANAEQLGALVAEFRVELKAFKGIHALPDGAAGTAEMLEYVDRGFPAYAAVNENGEHVGYLVCRVDEPTMWVESIFVMEEYRRMGIASLLLKKAEAIAEAYGESTTFHCVHPNNHRVIAFLRKHGYAVLNLIEIRKPYPEEKLTQRIRVGENEFDY